VGKSKPEMIVKHGTGAGSTVEVVESMDITGLKQGLFDIYDSMLKEMENPNFRCPKCANEFQTTIVCTACDLEFTPFNKYHTMNAAKVSAVIAPKLKELMSEEAKILEMKWNAKQCKAFIQEALDSISRHVKDKGVLEAILNDLRVAYGSGGQW
jgi:hypothetical protein